MPGMTTLILNVATTWVPNYNYTVRGGKGAWHQRLAMFCGIYGKTSLHRPDFWFQGCILVDRPWSLAEAIGRQGDRVERPKSQDRPGLEAQLHHFSLPNDIRQVLCFIFKIRVCISWEYDEG